MKISRLYILASITGLITGICAALFKLAIGGMASVFTSRFHASGMNWGLLVLPAIGFMLAYLYEHRFCRATRLNHGTELIAGRLGSGNYRLPARLTFSWMVAGTLTLGFGGSAGSEGPIACTGAAIGSNVARRAKAAPDMVRILLGCGAGAGIAAIFKSPLGGFLFTLEVLGMQLSTMSVMALLLSCLVASLTAYTLSGFTVDIGFIQSQQFDAASIPWILLLGVLCGFYSVYYSYIMQLMRRVYGHIRRRWQLSLTAGGVLGVLLLLMPALYGEGYNVMQLVLYGKTGALFADGYFSRFHDLAGNPWAIAAMCASLVAVKAFACSATTDGGVAGDFAPTLYAGCILGLLFATLANQIAGVHLEPAGFAFLAMAGVMAGVIRAPFMAIFLTAEMCNSYMLLLPLAVVAAISFLVRRFCCLNKPVATAHQST